MRYAAFVALALFVPVDSYSQAVVTNDTNKASSGYVFYAPTASEASHLLRNDGTIAHSWPGSGPAGAEVKLLADGTILRTTAIDTSVFADGKGKGGGGKIEKWSWDGRLLWSYILPSPEKFIQHHDVQPLPNGNILIIAWELRTHDEAVAAGRAPATVPPAGIWSEAIFEVKPDPPSRGAIVWEWHVWDHLVQDVAPRAANFGTVAGNVRRIDLNFNGSNTNLSTDSDWLHFNSVSYNQKLDQIMLSSRPWSELWIIDHSTTTEEAASNRGGKYRRGGDLLYRWGNPLAYRSGTAADQRLFLPHNPHWIADGLAGAGHILVFNNGVGRGYSSADELVPPVDGEGSYQLDSNGRYGPDGPIWTFGSTAGTNFYTVTAGSAQRLRNGNTLICLSNANRVVEATPEKEIVWDLNLGVGSAGGFTFRAVRIPADSSQLTGTEFARRTNSRNAASMTLDQLSPGALAQLAGQGFASPPAVSIIDALGVSRPARWPRLRLIYQPFKYHLKRRWGPRLFVSGVGGAAMIRDFRVNGASPGLFSANGNGDGVGAIFALVDSPQGRYLQAAYRLDPTSRKYVPNAVPVTGPVYLSFFGTGFTHVNTAPVVTIGGVAVPVLSVNSLSQFPGLDQVSVGPVPLSLAGKPNQPVVATLSGIQSNAVEVSLK